MSSTERSFPSLSIRFLYLLVVAVVLPAAVWAEGAGNLAFDESSFEVAEEAGVALVTVERSQGEDGVVSVDYRTTGGGTATEGADYQPVHGTLTWADGDEGHRTFSVPIVDDDEAEGAETIGLVLDNPAGGAGLGDDTSSMVVILASDGGAGGDDDGDDDDNPGSLKFDESSLEVLESVGVAIVRVERSHGEAGAVGVSYRTTLGGTADPAADYTPVEGTLEWFAGDGSARTFMVPITDDADPEPSETIGLELFDPTGGADLEPGRDTAVIRILASDGGGGDDDDDEGDDDEGEREDDDGEKTGSARFLASTTQVLENAGMATVTVARTGGDDGALAVDFWSTGDTAEPGLDYSEIAGALTWPDNDDDPRTITVPILDDDLAEGNETLRLHLAGDVAAGSEEATLTIVDDDFGSACRPDGATLCLMGGHFRVRVEWRDFQENRGSGRAVTLSDTSGLFWFFGPGNYELLLKMVDGCDFNGSYWLFFAATTNVEIDVTVTDTLAGTSRTYRNPLGRAAEPVQDLQTFASCL